MLKIGSKMVLNMSVRRVTLCTVRDLPSHDARPIIILCSTSSPGQLDVFPTACAQREGEFVVVRTFFS